MLTLFILNIITSDAISRWCDKSNFLTFKIFIPNELFNLIIIVIILNE
jgi:hypothetical protein